MLRPLSILLALLLGVLPVMDELDARLRALESETSALRMGQSQLIDSLLRQGRARADAADTAAFEARLQPGTLDGVVRARGGGSDRTPALATPLLQRLMDDAGMSGSAPGRPDLGYPNLLLDPLFESVSGGATLTTSYASYGTEWEAKYANVSGTAPTSRSFTEQNQRGNPDPSVSVFLGFENSVTVDAWLGFGANAGSAVAYLRAATGWTPSASFLPSWLVASVRVLPSTVDAADLLTATMTLQIVDASDAVVAESEPVDILALYDLGEPILIEAALEAPDSAETYRWRVALAASKGAGPSPDVIVSMVDPMLAYSDDGAAPPFTPAVGPRWPQRQTQTVYRAANQSIPDNNDTAISWDTLVSGSGTMWSSSTNPDRFTAPQSGEYLITFHVRFAADAVGYRDAWILSGGIDYVRDRDNAPSGARGCYLNGQMILQMEKGDYARVIVYQNSGGALNVVGGYEVLASITLLHPGY